MAILQVRGVRVLAWCFRSLQERCLCLESQHQHPEHRSPERQAGTAGHYLAVVGMPMARELQLSGDVPVQDTDLELRDHVTRRQRERQSEGTAETTAHAKAPKCPHSFSSSSLLKERNGY